MVPEIPSSALERVLSFRSQGFKFWGCTLAWGLGDEIPPVGEAHAYVSQGFSIRLHVGTGLGLFGLSVYDMRLFGV